MQSWRFIVVLLCKSLFYSCFISLVKTKTRRRIKYHIREISRWGVISVGRYNITNMKLDIVLLFPFSKSDSLYN